ncbi:MAG: hypothetical protein JWR80_8529 [Bradyrhizobium sp.]|nr:hypothetical protein [Bradyrhizobium sp.]
MDRIVSKGSAMEAAFYRASPAKRSRMALASRATVSKHKPGMTLEEARRAANEPFGTWMPVHTRMEWEVLRSMTITVLEAPLGVGFITSDSPVVWHDGRNHALPDARPVGLAHPAIEVSMPITPRFCVLFDRSRRKGNLRLNEHGVAEINARTLRWCVSYFIGSSAELTVDWVEPAGRWEGAP